MKIDFVTKTSEYPVKGVGKQTCGGFGETWGKKYMVDARYAQTYLPRD